MALEPRVWIWPKLKSVVHAIQALRFSVGEIHDDARMSAPETATRLRTRAEDYNEAFKDLDNELTHRQPPMMKNSVGATAPGANAASAAVHEGNVKLLPWLMLTAMLSGIALGVSVVSTVSQSQNQAQSESRTHAELERQNRFLQEYRIRVEDAEIAAEEVNPKFHPRRTE